MKRSRFGGLAALAVIALLASFAVTAGPAAGGTAPQSVRTGDAIDVHFAVTKFVARGKTIVAVGKTIATVQTTDGAYTVAKPFATRVVRSHGARGMQSATRICDVLTLNLGPLHLELLGLIVDLNKVVLTIKADSNGGLLGGLLCGLAGGSGLTPTALTSTAAQLTKAAQTSGLKVGPGFTVPLAAASPSTQAYRATCTVLDLVLGPLDLNLLGLLVHLDQVHLTITADPTKGLLGGLLCGLAGGLPTGG